MQVNLAHHNVLAMAARMMNMGTMSTWTNWLRPQTINPRAKAAYVKNRNVKKNIVNVSMQEGHVVKLADALVVRIMVAAMNTLIVEVHLRLSLMAP